MPWNDNANSGQKPGPWGAPPPSGGSGGGSGGGGGGSDGGDSGGGGGGKGRGGGPRGPRRPNLPPPDFNDLSRQLKNRVDRLFGGGGGGKGIGSQTLAVIGGVAFALWAMSGLYINQPNQEAVVTTFGAFSSVTGPGLKYHLPFPIQSHVKVPVTEARRTVVGGSQSADQPKESLMLTGDENIVNLDFTVLWKISDAQKYVFQVREPEETVKAVAESAMREVVGRMALDPILTTGRAKLAADTRDLMQRVLDSYGSGIRVNEVQISTAAPPDPVVEAFRDVASAKQNAESAANEARGQAAQIKQAALGYRAQVVQEAAGEAARFNQVYAQYKLAPAVTRQRLYVETMERVLKNSKKVIVDSKGASAPIILPPDAFRPRDAATAQPGAGR